MANVSITNLPAAQPLTGTELVPVVQGGLTVRTTTAAISASPSLTQTFLTVNNEPTLPNSRYFSTDANLILSDGGAQSFYRISLTGAAASLNTAGNGVVVKSGTSILNRTLSTSGNGLSVANGDGISGNPTFSLTGNVQSLANASGTGMLVLTGPSALTFRTITGTASQIAVADGDGVFGNPTVGIANNPTLPGTGAAIVPKGTTAQQPAGVQGQFRYNTDTGAFEGYTASGWGTFSTAGGVTTFSAGTTGFSPSAPTAGAIVLTGTLNVTNGGTGATSLTGYVKGSGTSAFTASATIPTTDLSGQITNAQLQNSSITINGNSVSLGGSTTVTATTTNPLTAGTGLQFNSGTTFDGSAAKTISIDSSVVTLTGTQTLTGKTISGASNTLSNIPNASLDNSSVTINGTSVALGGSATITANTTNSLTFNNSGSGAASGTAFNGGTAYTISYNTVGASPLAGSSSITTVGTVTSGTWNATPITNAYLANSSLTIGTTNIALGGTSLTLAGLTSITLTQDPVSDLQVATKQYVDSIASGLNYHQPVNYASTTTLPAYTYNNGTSGVGATITANANGALSFGGGSPTAGQRLLVKDEVGANAPYNGIYTVTSAGSAGSPFQLTRATDYDTSGTGTNEIDAGDYVLVLSGTNASTAWVQQTPLPIIVGTTDLVFLQFNAPITYTAGTGLNLSPATTFNISNTGVTAASYGTASSVPTIAVNAQGQITSASNTSIAINGNQITSGTVGSSYISGSYTGITGVGTLTAGIWNASTIGVAYGGTGLASYTTGDLLYASATTTLSKLGIGTNGQILTSSGTVPQWTSGSSISVGTATNLAGGTAGALPYQTGAGATTFLSLGTTNYVLTAGASAPQYVAQSTLSVGSATNATNATNTAITANSTNATNYLTFVSATTGNLPQLVNSSLTVNPSTGAITGGISGGTF